MSSPARTAPRRARLAALAAALLAVATVVVVATTGSEPAAAGPPPVMRAFVPLPTNDFQGYLESVNSAADTTISFTVGVTNAAAGATIYYDHHEDGFEADIANPTQPSTLVFGDGNAANGNAATYCGACSGDLLPQGAPLIMRSSIPTPRNTANRFFDGGDKVASTRGITITAGGFSTPLNSVLSGVVSAYDTSKYGTSYTVPVGEDTPFPTGTTDAFSYTGASIMAAEAGTVVEIDTDGDGDTDRTETVGQGGSVFVNGGLDEGARITASKPIQVHLLTGRRLSDYEARSFTLYPDEVLSNDYMSPAGSGRDNFRTVNYLFNPGSTPLVVTPTCTGCSGTITVAPRASAAFHSPVNQAVRFSSTGARFIAIAGVGAQSGAPPGGSTNESRVYDWGFTMLPTSQLTTQVALGWAPGNSAVPPSTTGTTAAYDPVWVTTLTATTIHVDYDGNPATGSVSTPDCFGARHDADIDVNALASTKIFDPDGDMTGARIYTCDGTKIAGAWGQDPSTASQGAPGFDAGYTIIPTTVMVVEKTARVATDVDGDGGFGPGDTMTYEIAIADAGSLAFTDVEAEDILPAGLAYVEDSTRLVSGSTTTPFADDGPPAATPFPLDEGGVSLPDVAAGQTVYLRFEAAIVDPWVDDTATIGNTACVRAAEAVACDTSSTALTNADVSITKTRTTPNGDVGEDVTFLLTVANAGPDTAPGLEVTDLLPAGLAFVSADASAGTYDDATGIWAVGDLADGADETLEITATVETDEPITNVAEITGGSFVDLDDSDDRAEAEADFAPVIDLEIAKEVTAGPAADGTTTFRITLANTSTMAGTGVVVADTLGGAGEVTAATPSVGAFDPATGEWTVGTIAGGGTETLDVTVAIDDLPTTNAAEVVEADQPDVDSTPGNGATDPEEDDRVEIDVVSDFVDLEVDKTVTPAPWIVGEDVTFTVTVANLGPADATGVEVTDLLPAELELVDATPSQGAYDGTTGVWSIGDLAADDDATLTIEATLVEAGPPTNGAQVTAADQDDVDSTPDTAVDGEDDEGEAGLVADGNATVVVLVWDDEVGDGAQAGGEPGLTGVTVRVFEDTDGDGTYELLRGTDVTGGGGAWSIGSLDTGDFRVVVDTATVPAGYVATTATTFDVALVDGEVRLDLDAGFSATADLAVAKGVLSVGEHVGDQVTYRITVTNDGPADATGVVVEDRLPAGLTLAEAAPSQGTYTAGTGLWTVGDLADGATATLDLTATTTSAAPIANTATVVASDQPDPDPDDDEATAPIDVDALVDVSVTKEVADPAPTHVGDEVTFTVTVANDGPSDATGVEVTDLLPTGLTLDEADPSVGTYDETTGVWAVGDLAAGPDATITDTATVEPETTTNVAELTGLDQDDTATDDDSDSAEVTVDPLVDLSVEKTATAPAAIGGVAAFEVRVTNRGPSVATGVEVTDLLPAGLDLVSATPSAGTYDATTGVWSVDEVAVDGVVTLEVTAILEVGGPVTNVAELTGADQDDTSADDDTDSAEVSAPGASIGDRVWDDLDGDGTQDDGEPGLEGVTVTLYRGPAEDGDEVASTTTGPDGAYVFDGLAPGDFEVVVDASTVPAGHVPTTPTTIPVTVASGEEVTDADAGFSGAADLALTKELTAAPTYVGDMATFRVRVANVGPATATGIVVSDPQPAGLLFQDATPSQGTFDDATGEWAVGDLADGESATIDLTYRVDIPAEITNTAEIVATDQDDPTEDDRTAEALVDVDSLIDLSVTKEEVGDPTYLGQRAVFEVTVSNAGPSTASAVAVTDLLPAGLAFLSADPEIGTYDPATGIWAVGQVPAGTSYVLEVRAQVNALSTTNTAEVSGAAEDDADSTPGNIATAPGEDDGASVDVTVAPRADLSLEKTATPPAFAGQAATFVIEVANGGPSLATGVEVTDQLPAGLTFVSATPTAGTYDPATGVWTIGALPVDGSEQLTITAILDVLGPVTNTAEVTAVDQADPDSTPGNADAAPDEDDTGSAEVAAPGGSIGDRVWDDVDGDGTQDDGEPGLEGVTVTLLQGGAEVDTTTTGADGAYRFDDVLPGAYEVVVDMASAPAGYVATTPATVPVDLLPGADEDDADVGLSTAVDLRVDKTLTGTPPDSVGGTATFTVTVTNDGPATATGVVVGDQLPAGLAFVASTPSQGGYDAGTGRWTVGTLAAGSSATLGLAAVVGEEQVVNTAEVLEVDQVDPDDEDDTDTATVDVDALVDVSLTKELTTPPVHIGDEATFTVTVANAGPSPATGVEVTDLLPDDLTFVSAAPSAGDFDDATGVWTVGDVPAGDEETLEVVVTVDTTDPVTNTAEVTAAAEADADSEPGNRDTDPGEDDADSATVTAAPLVDLSLAKTETAEPTHLGDVATFVITVANAGPSTATGIDVDESLPAGLGFVSADATEGGYDPVTGIWTIPSLAADRAATLPVRATGDALAVAHTAAGGGGDQDDAAEGDDSDTAAVAVEALVDVSVDKVETANPTVVGDEASFTITVANGGPAPATGVEVTDLLPAGLAFVAAEAEVGTYDDPTGVWTVGTLAAGTDATLVVTALVGDLTVTNVAEVTATVEDDADSTPDNGATDPAEDDRDSVELTVDPRIDLSLAKELTVAPTHVGDEATFTLTVANAGPSPATGVEVLDRLPDGLTYVGDDTGGAYDPETGVWTVGAVGPLASRTLALTVRVDVPSVTNLAEVSAADQVDVDSAPIEDDLGPADPPDQDDEAAAAVEAEPLADLSLAKTSSPATVEQGEEATFTLTVTNAGPSPATGIEVTDELPEGVTFVSAAASVGAYDEATGVWTIGSLADEGTATLDIVVTVDAAGPIENRASITARNEDDPDLEDGVDSTVLDSEPRIDLSVTKAVSDPVAAIGSEVEFTVTVANDGPSEATGVEVTDALPAGLGFVAAEATAGTYDEESGVWSVPTLSVGSSATLNVTASVDGTAEVTNAAEVTAADQADVDSTPANGATHPAEDDRATATVSGIQVDLELGIAVDASEVAVGDTVAYTVTVLNRGPSPATGVAVVDLLPEGLAFVGATPSAGSYDPASGLWSIGDVAVDGTVTLEIVARVLGPGPIANQAEVSAAVEPDVDSTPNDHDAAADDQDAVTVTGLQVDLSLTKTVDVTTPDRGGEVTYTLRLTNGGPSAATGVVVADGLPDGLEWVRDSSGGAYSPATGRWTIGRLDAGASVAIRITTRVTGIGPLTNEATVVAADQPDRDSTPGNDDAREDDQDAVTVVARTASLAGLVWLDVDQDGAFDDVDIPIPGVTVLLYDGDGNLSDSILTGEDGTYAFAFVTPGQATVVVDESTLPDLVAGQTYDPDDVVDGAATLTLRAGEARDGIDFGYRPVLDLLVPGDIGSSGDEGSDWSPGDLLAATGLSTGPLVGIGLGLLLAGAALVAAIRRRRLA